jgi:pilus assembly protein FimV
MFVKMPRLLLLASIICPSLASALGLGEIHLNSALNEPLRAQIDLVAAAPEELTALHASMASADAFARYGIDRPPFISTVAFKVAKSKDGRDVLDVSSLGAISEPFVTFLVEVNWARGRLMREYTVLLDPPTYTPGEAAGSAAPVTGASGAPAPSKPDQQAPSMPADAQSTPVSPRRSSASQPTSTPSGSYRTVSGDTLMKIAQRAQGGGTGQVDQTMMAIFKANPDAFEGNINLLHRGTILRLPGADEIAALNQREAIDEVARQMSAWRGNAGATAGGGRLRLVTPKSSSEETGSGTSGGGGGADVASLKNRVKDLEAQLAESHRLVDVDNAQLADLQRKLASAAAAAAVAQAAPKPTAAAPAPPPPPAPSAPAATPATPGTPPAPNAAPAPEVAQSAAPVEPAPSAATAPPPAPKPAAPAAAPSGSWLDWITDHWQVPGALILILLAALGITAFRRRRSSDTHELSALAGSASHRAEPASSRDYAGSYNVTETFSAGDTAELKQPSVADMPAAVSDSAAPRATGDTMSAEGPVTIDQGDPIAEADFHMAYGLYDQAADLVRIALDREPERRDLRMKLLEIYFVWGNAENFLQTARDLAASRDHAAAGEWEKIMIMGKQICPDEDLFKQGTGGMHSPDSSIDLNLDGGENQVDIDLFGDATVEHDKVEPASARAREDDPSAETGESPHLRDKALDFVLDAPERGAEPVHEEPTVESEQMVFGDAPPASHRASDEHTAEVDVHDLGFDVDHLESTDTPASLSSSLESTDQSAASDSATVIAGMDEKSRRMLREAETNAKDTDLTQLERELEASFIAELAASGDDIKPSIVQESAPTVNMAANVPTVNMAAKIDAERTGKFERIDAEADTTETEVLHTDSTAKMKGIDTDGIDLDFSQLTDDSGHVPTAGDGSGDTAVREVFDNSQRVRAVDLDLSETVSRSAAIPNSMDTMEARKLVVKGVDTDIPGGEFAPVTMSEVGTKLDLARAYMDMGDPEGARSILEEVVQEGSASQKKEATRLIQSLPG